jgi:hypothetical protein
VTENVTQFPVAARREAVTQGKPTAPKKGGRARVISSMPPPKSGAMTAKGTGVEVGKHTRAGINRIGHWMDTLDAMRVDFHDEQDKTLEMQLQVIEAALAGLVIMHQPPTQKRPA